jgi:hypothetical protein
MIHRRKVREPLDQMKEKQLHTLRRMRYAKKGLQRRQAPAQVSATQFANLLCAFWRGLRSTRHASEARKGFSSTVAWHV